MLRVLGSDSVAEPGRAAAPILRSLYRQAGEVPYLWRARYNLAPTDPRYLEMTEEDMAADLLLAVYHQHRIRKDDPDDPVAQRWRAASTEARRAILRVKAEAERFTAQLRKVTGATGAKPTKRITKVTILR
jgi:hypothetical protein